MTRTVVLGEPPAPVAQWLERRRALGQDRYDEVWEGEYHVAPMAHSRHGDVDHQLVAILGPRAGARALRGSGPLNIGDAHDYRVPDQAYLRERAQGVFVPTAAIVVEIASPGDETYEKLGFWFARGVEELLIVDPADRSVVWYGRGAEALRRTGRSELLDLTESDVADAIDWPPAA